MAEVILENLSKRYSGGALALQDVNLHVADGELLALVGPSGCGKTTTLRLIAGLEKPSAGTIRIGRRVVNRDHPRDRNIAMIFQDYALYPHMSARRNMAFGLRMRKTSRAEIEQRIRHAADVLGITELLERKPGEMSGGERQRVALGRAMVLQPQCFLLDEPLSNLDPGLRTQLRAQIKSLHQRLKTTMIHVTHDQEEAMTLGQRVAVMRRGTIQQIGDPREVYQRPANRFVAGFLGSPAMNFIAGTVELQDEGVFFRSDDGRMPIAGPAACDLRSYRGALVLGVRPEHIAVHETVRPTDCTLEVRIEFTEFLGDQMNLHARSRSEQRIVVRCKPQEFQGGKKINLSLDPDELHFFEPGEFGRRVA